MLACLVVAHAQQALPSLPEMRGKRIALVIGNDAYQKVSKLEKAGNDATAMARELKAAGFEVMLHRDLNYRGMVKAVEALSNSITGGDQVVVFFAGHGVQLKTGSYLLPVDIEASSEGEVEKTAYGLNDLMDTLSEAKPSFSLVMVDACRNNPLKSKGRSVGGARGLSAIEPPKGQMVVYSASKGQQALDRLNDQDSDPNGVFTREFIAKMKQPGVRIEELLREVQDAVEELARTVSHDQRPAIYNEARGNFYFFGPTTVQAAQQGGGASSQVRIQSDDESEQELWNSIKDAKSPNALNEYLKTYSKGRFVSQAKILLAMLGTESRIESTGVGVPAAKPITNTAAGVLTAKPTTSDHIQIEREQSESRPKPEVAPVKAVIAASGQSDERNADLRLAGVPVKAAQGKTATKIQVAMISPEQKTSLPPPPTFPKLLSGLLEFPDGTRYVGGYKEDQDKSRTLHGRGEYISKAFRYEGEFRDGKKQGNGVYVWANGDRFEGEFANDQVSGKGKWEFASGDLYVGDVLNAIMVGKGILVSRNGDRYEGQFADGKPQGQGVYVFATGDKYEGNLVGGKMSGKGVYTTKSGDKFIATFVDGVANGNGSYEFANGDRYVGEIASGMLTGKGEYFHAGGQHSEGNYVNGQLNGPGKFHYNDGSWFEGDFEGGLKRAKGMMIQKDGSKRAAVIIDGAATFPGG